ncbi:MAG: 3'(2'),5'-bisphosphate nucleotidase CysQ family protein [Alphaproteobacteria bacterium]
MHHENLLQLQQDIENLAIKAGELIVGIANNGFQVQRKIDHSPVTEADKAADDLIVQYLMARTPDIPVISEESWQERNWQNCHKTGCFWLVDPLDGTNSFIKHEPNFSVHIALIKAGVPVLGVIHAPLFGETVSTAGTAVSTRYIDNNGCVTPIIARAEPQEGHLVAISSGTRGKNYQARVQHFLEEKNISYHRQEPVFSKMVELACGRADVFPCLGGSGEWDTAAGQAIVEALGGRVNTLEGKPLTYGKDGFQNPYFVAYAPSTQGLFF